MQSDQISEPLPKEIHQNAGQKEEVALNKIKAAGKIAPEESPVADPLKPIKTISAKSPRMASLKNNLSQQEVGPDELSAINRTSTSGFNMMEDDTISSASFNSKMFDQFKDLDSISQLGNGQDFDESGINLGAIKYELQAREKKIRSLHAEKLKLRALLKKAKTTIDTINNNYK